MVVSTAKIQSQTSEEEDPNKIRVTAPRHIPIVIVIHGILMAPTAQRPVQCNVPQDSITPPILLAHHMPSAPSVWHPLQLMGKSRCARTGWPSSWTGPLKAVSGARVAAAATARLCCMKWDALAAKAYNLQLLLPSGFFCFCLLHVDDGRG
jgi:hypothetical protein